MGVSWRDIDHAELAAGNGVFDDIPTQDMAKADHRITFQDDVPVHEGVDARDDRTIGVAFPI